MLDRSLTRSRRSLAILILAVLTISVVVTGVSAAVASQADDATVEFDQTTTGNVFLADETVTIDVESDADRVVWTLERYGGERIENGTLDVDGETTLTLSVEEVGQYELVAWPAGSSGDPASTTVAVLPADGFDNDDTFYGMSTHFQQGWDHDVMPIMDAAGVATARDEHAWLAVEESRGTYDFSGRTRAEFMEKLRDRGFQRLFIFGYGNPIYGGDWNHAPDTDAYRQAYANYSTAVIQRYEDLEYVEVWNEYNLEGFASGPAGVDPAAYAELLTTTYPAVKDERSDVTVVGGATSGVAADWWEGVLQAGGADHMDAMSIHPYRNEPTGYAADVEQLRTLTREYNDGETLPIWVTEFGWSTGVDSHSSAPAPDQARHLVQSHVRLRAAGIQRAYWYTFRDDDPTGPDGGPGQWGLVRHPDDPAGAHTPRPSLVAYATMTRQVAGADGPTERTDSPVDHFVYDAGGEPTNVLWVPSNDAARDVTLHTDEPVTVTTMTGERQQLVPTDGTVYLTVDADPLYVAGNVTSVTEGAPVGIEGTSDDLDLGLQNDRDESLTVSHAVADQTTELSAGAGSSAEQTIPLPGAYRPLRPPGADVFYLGGGHRVVDTVSIDGEPVGLLSTRVRPSALSLTEPSEQSTATPDVRTATETETRTDGQAMSTTSASGPGFDVAVALFALVASALVALRRGN